MNHLRSVAFAAVSVSMLVVAAGCNADITADTAPSTEVVPGVETKAWSTPASVCPAKDPEWHQVQASRVAKYLFGGNDPWDWSLDAAGNPVGASKEFGPAGSAKPDLGDPECDAAAKCWRAVHETLYPSCPDADRKGEVDPKIDPKAEVKPAEELKIYEGKDGPTIYDPDAKPVSTDTARTSTPPPSNCPASSNLWGGGDTKACGLPAELFNLKIPYSFPHDLGKCIEQLDKCWSPGVSGFMYIKDPQKQIVGFDPEPADLTTPLGSSTGAVAYARYTSTYVPTIAILWPDYWEYGSIPAGTPCNNYGLPPGARTWRAIVASGSLRKCL